MPNDPLRASTAGMAAAQHVPSPDGAPDAVLVVRPVRSPTGRVADAEVREGNEAAAGLAARTPGTLRGLLLSELLPGAHTVLCAWVGAAVDGAGGEARARLELPGGPRTVRCQVSPLGEDVAVVLHDAADELRQEGRLRATRDLGPAELLVLDSVRDAAGELSDLLVADLNARAAARLGAPPDGVLGRRMSELVGGERLRAMLARHEGVLAAKRTVELEEQAGDRWLVSQLTPLDDAVAVLTRDETERRLADREARRMAEQFRFVARAAADLIAVHDPDGRFRFASDASRHLVGRDPERLVGMHPLQLLSSRDRREGRRVLGALVEGLPWAGVQTLRVQRPDGSTQALDVMVRPLRDAGGGVTAYISVSRDASERLASEQRAARQVAEQRALRRVATAAARSDSGMPSVAGTIAGQLAQLLDAGAAVLVRLEGAPAPGLVVAAAGPEAAVPADRPLPAPVRPRPHDEEAVPVEAPGLVRGRSRQCLGSAVLVDGRLWGVLVAAPRAGAELPPRAPAVLERFAELTAVAVSAVHARERLADQARTDPLTGLPNHRQFHERLRSEAARALRHGRPLSLALFDVDHFKRVNTLHGHQSGDATLAEIAARLRANLRDGEMLARTGGEEFGWILVETTAEEAFAAVERTRRAVAAGPVVSDVTVTVSAGICDLARAGSADELFRLADGALYWAKATGRDRSVLYAPDTVAALSAEERAERLERSQALVALRSLARAVDAKDPSTHAHSERVSRMCERIAHELGWELERAAQLAEAGLLHDVGKIGVPDAVLLKAGPLDAAEYEVVKRHAALGAEIADEALSPEQCGWIRGHHEWWDGSGYPDGTMGDAIPEGARIIAVADAWDVMTRARHYGTIRDEADALAELRRGSGTQFWPDAVAALAAVFGDLQ
ncbi:MAG: diguanylate cyclase [Thermoleophilia bacterium]